MTLTAKIKRHRDLLILCFCLSCSALATGVYYDMLNRQSESGIEQIRTVYTERAENLINSVFHKTDVLAAAVKLTNGSISYRTFNEIASLVYEENRGIRGIQYMPRAVVTYSYPVKGNEAVIGKDFLKIPERLKDVKLAIDTRSIALSGPYHLIQGGLGVVARNPVFLRNGAGAEYFWGFSAIILDLPLALERVGLGNLPKSGYDFQLFCVNENNERLVIAGNPALDTDKAVRGVIRVPHHEWILAIAKLDPWSDLLKTAVAFLFGTLLSLVLWLLYRTMQQRERAVAAKDKFFSDISHDMRTPLNAVIGFSTLALRPQTTEQEKDSYLAKIQTSGKLLLDLINDTLTISKMDNGKLELNPAPVRLAEINASIMEPISAIAAQKGVILIMDKSGCRPRTLMADKLSVQKIFLNLLNNAVKFTPAGGRIWITIRDEPAGARDAALVVEVRDEGIGIGRNFLPHIFEPFSQEEREGYKGTGTGLGLSIVRQLVGLMGGTVAAASEVGRGTAFTVKLPLKETEAQEDNGPAEAQPERKQDLSGNKVLLCEDNALNREIAAALLQDLGIVTTEAEDGQIGVKLFTESKPREFAAILMDLRMPVMDGYAAVRAIRALPRPDAKTVPIIAMTADAYPEDVGRCLAAGMDSHLSKPIDPDALNRVLSKFIGGAAEIK